MAKRDRGGSGHSTAASAVRADRARAKEMRMAIAFGLCLVGMLALPLPITQAKGIDIAAAAVGLLGLASAALLLVLSPSFMPNRRLGAAWMALLAWLLLTGLISHRVWASLVGEPTNMLGWFTLLSLTAIAMTGYRLRNPLRELLVRWGWVVVLAQSGYALYQRVILGDAMAAGTLSNSTNLGVALLLLLPWSLPPKGVLPARQVRLRMIVGAGAVLALIASASRLSSLIAVGWLVWAIITNLEVRTPIRWVTVTGLIIVAVGTAGALSSGEFGDMLSASVLGQRPQIYEQAFHAVAARPLTGWGADGFLAGGAATSTIERARAGELATFGFGSTDPHNLALWVAVSAGWVGVLLFAWFAAEAAMALMGVRHRSWARPAAWSLCGALAVTLTAPFALHVLPLFVVVFAASLAASTAPETARHSVPVGRTAAVATIAMMSVVLAANAATRARFEEPGAARSPLVVQDALEASEFWGGDAHLAYLSSLHLGWSGMAATDPTVPARDLASLEHAASADERNPVYALELARAVEFYGAPASEVDAAFDEVFERYPAYPLAHAEYAAYLAETGRLDESAEELAIASLCEEDDPELAAAVEFVKDALEEAAEESAEAFAER